MPVAGKVARAAVFLGVVLLVVGGSTAGSLLADVGGSRGAPAAYPEYDSSSIVPTRAESEGHAALERVDGAGLVLIDRAHANRFTSAEIQPLTSAITGTGARIGYLDGGADLGDALARADALVVIDPGVAYTDSEADRVETFVERGGRLLLLGEPTHVVTPAVGSGDTPETAHDRLGSLSTRFGFAFGADYLFNMGRNDGNFRSILANATGGGPLAEGVEQTAFHAAVQIETVDAEPVLLASNGTRTSRSDAPGEYALAARAGDVVAVGDTTFLRRGNYNVLDNERFLANLATFLASADRDRTLLEYPAVVDSDPSVRYTSPALLDAAQTIGRGTSGTATLSLSRRGGAGDADVLVTTFAHLRENGPGETGITVRGDRVSVPGYRSRTPGVAVVRSPEDGDLDLVVAADTTDGALFAARLLETGRIEGDTIGERTAVVRRSTGLIPRNGTSVS